MSLFFAEISLGQKRTSGQKTRNRLENLETLNTIKRNLYKAPETLRLTSDSFQESFKELKSNLRRVYLSFLSYCRKRQNNSLLTSVILIFLFIHLNVYFLNVKDIALSSTTTIPSNSFSLMCNILYLS